LVHRLLAARSSLIDSNPFPFRQALLAELVAADQIASGTTWKSIYPLIDSDPRYLNLLGTPGSSPLDLFWDVVDELDVRAEQDEQVVEFVAKEKGIRVDDQTKEDDFVEALQGDERIEKMDLKAIKSTFDKVSSTAWITLLAGPGN
jgi:pre-mRNA-processing factor 40